MLINKTFFFLKKSFKNPAILYVLCTYSTYIIQFINSLFIAAYLGPYYLGIWGFINLILGYINQLNLGIPYSLNIIISVEKNNEKYVQKVIGNSLSMMIILCILILVFFLITFIADINIGDKYNFETFFVPVCIIAVLSHFNNIYSNIFRVYGRIYEIVINQSLSTFVIIFALIIFRGEILLWAMVIANLFSVLVSLIIYLIKTPINLKLFFDLKLIKYIQEKGWHLFLYNSSFAFILISTKSFISGSYQVEEYGYFTFSFSLANAILLLLNSLSYLITPKITNRFANSNIEHIKNILEEVRTSYTSLSHLLIHFVIMLFPLFLLLFPQYKEVNNIFKVTSLTIVLTTNLFGYINLLAARDEEKVISKIAIIALIINVLLVLFFIFCFNIKFSYVMFPTMISYFFLIFFSAFAGRKTLLLPTSIIEIVRDIFPWRMSIPFFISILLIILSIPDIYFIIPFVVYLLLNLKDLKRIIDLCIKLINNPNFINI